MQLINYTKPRLLIADEGKQIRDKNDIYREAYFNDELGVEVPEHIPAYSSVIFPGVQIQTLEQAQELYVEDLIESEVEE